MVVFLHVSNSQAGFGFIEFSCLVCFFIDFLNFFVSLSMSFNPRLTYKKYPINTRCLSKSRKIRKNSSNFVYIQAK